MAAEPHTVYVGLGADPDQPLFLDADAAAQIAEAYGRGDETLRAFAPELEPVLWPEHFDVAIRVDEVNYGISPGDGYSVEPYAYVGVGTVAEADRYWNAPFGASRAMSALSDAGEVRAFFADARERLLGRAGS